MKQNYTNYNLELKSATETGKFSGYASVFNVIDSYQDIVLPGAFKDSLQQNKDVKLLWQHNPEKPIGYFTKIEENTDGLYVEGQIQLDVRRGKEAYSLLKSGAINGLSIGYEVDKSFEHNDSRYIKAARLWEISIVTFPANEKATIHDIKDAKPLKHLKNALKTAKSSLIA